MISFHLLQESTSMMLRNSSSTRFLLPPCVLASLMVASCSGIVGIDDTSASVANLPPTFYTCYKNQPTPADVAARVTITTNITLLDGVTQVKDVSVRACQATDGDCKSVLGMATTDDQGAAPLSVPATSSVDPSQRGFRGYLEISGKIPDKAGSTNFVPMRTLLWFFSEPVTTDINFPVFAITEDTWTNVIAKSQVGDGNVLADRGDLFLEFRDCADKNAADVAFTVSSADDKSTVPLIYTKDQNFSKDLKYTDSFGRGAMFNVPKGSADITLRPKDATADVSRVTVFFRSDANTTGFFRPNQ
jgi:hypothetical protein